MMNIYLNKSKHKIITVLVALLIGSGSVFYTNMIVKRLAQREQEQIELYAEALKYFSNLENDEPVAFLQLITENTIFPSILVDEKGNILPSGARNVRNLEGLSEERKQERLQEELEIMKEEHLPIVVKYGPGQYNYIYYRNSYLLSQLRYYPYVQLTVIAVFVVLGYLTFSSSRRAEQNRVWVGLAKETAHQLGTPLSALMAWIEYFKADPKYAEDGVVEELEKDVQRLEMITARFSSIGSVPTLKEENVMDGSSILSPTYKKRISTKVKMYVTADSETLPGVKMNKYLFEWVIENLCKNAVDAMSGIGEIRIHIKKAQPSKLTIDISDTGKGISKANQPRVFDAGFSTKK